VRASTYTPTGSIAIFGASWAPSTGLRLAVRRRERPFHGLLMPRPEERRLFRVVSEVDPSVTLDEDRDRCGIDRDSTSHPPATAPARCDSITGGIP